MANYNLTNQDIKDTFEQLAQVSGSIEGGVAGSGVTDGTGSRVTNLHVTASNALSSSTATSAISSSHAVQADSSLTAISSSHSVASDTSISASHAIQADSALSSNTSISASHAVASDSSISASHAVQSDNATSASFATTALSASYAPGGGVTSIIAGTNITIDQSTGDVTINSSGGGGSADTGSLLVTASNVDATITYTKGDGSTFQNIINNVANASTATSASHAVIADSSLSALTATSASHAVKADSANSATSASYAVTASYAENAGGAAFPFTGNAEITGSLIVSQSGLSSGDDVFVLGAPRTGGSSLEGVIRSTVDDGLHLYGNKNYTNGANTFSGGIIGFESGPVQLGAAGSPVSLEMKNGSAIVAPNNTLPITGSVDISGSLAIKGIPDVSASIAAAGGGGAAFPFTGSAGISGSLNVSGSFRSLGGQIQLGNTGSGNSIDIPQNGTTMVKGSTDFTNGAIYFGDQLNMGGTFNTSGGGSTFNLTDGTSININADMNLSASKQLIGTASYAMFAETTSGTITNAATASYVNPLTQSVDLLGNLNIVGDVTTAGSGDSITAGGYIYSINGAVTSGTGVQAGYGGASGIISIKSSSNGGLQYPSFEAYTNTTDFPSIYSSLKIRDSNPTGSITSQPIALELSSFTTRDGGWPVAQLRFGPNEGSNPDNTAFWSSENDPGLTFEKTAKFNFPVTISSSLDVSGSTDIDGVLSLPGIANVSASIAAGGGGGGTPAGVDTQIQYNNAGAFGAGSFLTTNKTNNVNITNELGLVGDGSDQGLLKLYCESGTAHFVGLKGPNHSGGSSYTLQLPNTLPSVANQVLESNASGTLSWIATPGSTAFPFTGSAGISGSLVVDGNITTNERLTVGSADPRVGSNFGIYTDRQARFDSTVAVENGGTLRIDTSGAGGNIPFRATNAGLSVDNLTVHELTNDFDVTIAGATKITGSLQITGSTDINGTLSLPGIANVSASIAAAGGGSVDTGSLLITASNVDAVITYTKGDGSVFTNTINNVANATSASYALTASYAANAGGSPGLVAGSGTDSMQSSATLTPTQGASAGGTDSIALGEYANASDPKCVAIGRNARATASDAIAIGNNPFAGNTDAICIGNNSETFQTYGVAIGSSAVAGASGAVALGKNVTSSTANTTAVNLFQITQYASMNFTNDTTAAAGGIPLGGVYHTSGALKIRIS